MTAIRQNVEMWRGDSKTIRVTVRNKDKTIPDLSQATARWWLATGPTAASALVEKATDDGITISGNIVDIVLDPADTEDLTAIGLLYHELELTLAGGFIATAMVGTFKLNGDIIPPVETP